MKKILFLTFIFMLCLSSTCFAAIGSTSGYPSLPQKGITLYQEYIIFENSDNKEIRCLYFSSSNSTLLNQSTYSDGVLVAKFSTKTANAAANYAEYKLVSGEWSRSNQDSYKNVYTKTFNASEIIYSSSDFATYEPLPDIDEPTPEEPLPDNPTVSLPSGKYDNTYYLRYIDSSGRQALASFSSDSPITFSAEAKDSVVYIYFTFTEDSNYRDYYYEDNKWNMVNNVSYTGPDTKNINLVFNDIISSSFDIKNEDGSIFFPLTPTAEMEKLGAKIIQAMITIVTIAVSCLALLISLAVLLKVLRRFLA